MSFRSRMILAIIVLGLAFSLMSLGVAEARSKTKHVGKHTKTKWHTKKIEKKKKIPQRPKGILAKAVYCVNLTNNQTLMARNPDQQLPVASLTKLVTAMVVLDNMPMKDKVEVPEHIKSVPKTVVGLNPGDSVTVEDLLHGILIGSGNDCAETLACGFPGGKKKFISAMNKKVADMGMKKTKFFTPSGLDLQDKDNEDKPVDSNVSTAKEIALIAKEAFQNKTIRSICLKKSYTIAGGSDKSEYFVRTTNRLLNDRLPLVGAKTGFTCKAGHCLATEFRPGPNNFVIVVLGSPNHFRDTQLVYHKALQETIRSKANTRPGRPKNIASHL